MSRLEQRIKDLESQFDEEQRRLVEAERFFPFCQLNWCILPSSPLLQCSIHETYIWDYIKVSAAHDQKDKGADLLTGGGSQEPWGGQTQNSNSPTTTCFNHSFKSAGFFHIHFLAIFEPFFTFLLVTATNILTLKIRSFEAILDIAIPLWCAQGFFEMAHVGLKVDKHGRLVPMWSKKVLNSPKWSV